VRPPKWFHSAHILRGHRPRSTLRHPSRVRLQGRAIFSVRAVVPSQDVGEKCVVPPPRSRTCREEMAVSGVHSTAVIVDESTQPIQGRDSGRTEYRAVHHFPCLPHLARAAFFAISRRFSGGTPCQRSLPPFLPPSLPHAWKSALTASSAAGGSVGLRRFVTTFTVTRVFRRMQEGVLTS